MIKVENRKDFMNEVIYGSRVVVFADGTWKVESLEEIVDKKKDSRTVIVSHQGLKYIDPYGKLVYLKNDYMDLHQLVSDIELQLNLHARLEAVRELGVSGEFEDSITGFRFKVKKGKVKVLN